MKTKKKGFFFRVSGRGAEALPSPSPRRCVARSLPATTAWPAGNPASTLWAAGKPATTAWPAGSPASMLWAAGRPASTAWLAGNLRSTLWAHRFRPNKINIVYKIVFFYIIFLEKQKIYICYMSWGRCKKKRGILVEKFILLKISLFNFYFVKYCYIYIYINHEVCVDIQICWFLTYHQTCNVKFILITYNFGTKPNRGVNLEKRPNIVGI